MPKSAVNNVPTLHPEPSLSALERFMQGKNLARDHAQTLTDTQARLDEARSFCKTMLSAFWKARAHAGGVLWPVVACPHAGELNEPLLKDQAVSLGTLAAQLDDLSAGYWLGTVYTAMLPQHVRSGFGAYYTPPAYVVRLMDQAQAAGVDWSSAMIADPACGGGAFLAPLALRMRRHSKHRASHLILEDITRRLRGFELDPFAAWMSHVTLEAALLDLCVKSNQRMPSLISVGDSLQAGMSQEFDLVIGNPPYGRVSLNNQLRALYARSLYGHANLYGLFTDLAVHWTKPGGVIAFVTPTSFIGGQYFKALRGLLLEQAPPVSLDFIDQRRGVFDDVLQETLLAVFRKSDQPHETSLFLLTEGDKAELAAQSVDTVSLPKGQAPWLLLRQAEQTQFMHKLRSLDARLSTYGYVARTGPLVWNRNKDHLRDVARRSCYPLIWAESISSEGFSFSAKRKNHAAFVKVDDPQSHLLLRVPCVLMQRTSAKEQAKRMICTVLPLDFLMKHQAVVVENHVNVILPDVSSAISPRTMALVLSSEALDRAFRCLSGSVSVSAYELESLPLPNEKDMLAIEAMVLQGADPLMIERRINKAYGLA